MDCAGGEYGNNGCNGGLMNSAFDYIADHGIETETDYPYRAVDQRCKAAESRSKFRIKGHYDVPESDNI